MYRASQSLNIFVIKSRVRNSSMYVQPRLRPRGARAQLQCLPFLLSAVTPPAATSTTPFSSSRQSPFPSTTPITFCIISITSSPYNPTFAAAPPDAPAPPLAPRVRTLVFRGFLGALPESAHNPLLNHNPRGVLSSDCLTFTTDARMSKTGELLPNHRSGGNATVGTSGGAATELCFWCAATNNQWRVRGRCYLLADEDVDISPEITTVLERRLEPTGVPGRELWTWRREIQAHWGNLTPGMRGSFANPPPGTPLDVDLGSLGPESGGGAKLRKGVVVSDEKVLANEGIEMLARRNFRVGVVVPEMVERVDLGSEGEARRWVYWWVGGTGEGIEAGWKGTETWP